MRRISLAQAAAGVLLCVLAVWFVAPAAAQSTGDERRIALVVGNFGYEHVPRLANPGNDATLIATTLHQLGFTLVGGGAQDNVDKAHFDKLVQDFGRAIQGADVALFYYAGHGMQVDGTNWLAPTDANPTRPQDLEFQMVDADLVLKQMNGAGTRLNLVILDACRNNPFAALGTRAVQGGLAQMSAPEGTMISFATQPGNVAGDGTGTDGPYATALAAAMRKPGLDIFRVFNQVGLTVKRVTDGAQLPWESSSPIDGEFYFTPSDSTPDLVVTAEAAPALPPTPPGSERGAAPGATPAPATRPPPRQPPRLRRRRLPHRRQVRHRRGNPRQPCPARCRLWQSRERPTRSSISGLPMPRGRAWRGTTSPRATGSRLPPDRASQRPSIGWESCLNAGAAATEATPKHCNGTSARQTKGFRPPRSPWVGSTGAAWAWSAIVARRTEWFRRAAEQGNPVGQWALGNFYQFGNGVDKDMSQALQWYRARGRSGLRFRRGSGSA